MSNVTMAVTYRVTNPTTGCRGGVEIPTIVSLAQDAPTTVSVVDFQHAHGCACLCAETDMSSPNLQCIHEHVKRICETPGGEYDVEVLAVVFLKLVLGLPVPDGFELDEGIALN